MHLKIRSLGAGFGPQLNFGADMQRTVGSEGAPPLDFTDSRWVLKTAPVYTESEGSPARVWTRSCAAAHLTVDYKYYDSLIPGDKTGSTGYWRGMPMSITSDGVFAAGGYWTSPKQANHGPYTTRNEYMVPCFIQGTKCIILVTFV